MPHCAFKGEKQLFLIAFCLIFECCAPSCRAVESWCWFRGQAGEELQSSQLVWRQWVKEVRTRWRKASLHVEVMPLNSFPEHPHLQPWSTARKPEGEICSGFYLNDERQMKRELQPWCGDFTCHRGFVLAVEAKQRLPTARWREAGSLWLHRLALITVRLGKESAIDFLVQIRWMVQTKLVTPPPQTLTPCRSLPSFIHFYVSIYF